MKFGVILPNYGINANADSIVRSALKSEELGFDSVWTTDHVIVPPKFREDYGTTYESLTTLALLSGITSQITLGTSILVVPMRNPLYLSKQIATIDSFSKGRLIVGAASGYLEEEFGAIGANFKQRGKYFDESLEIMKLIWKNDLSTFEGEFFRFKDMISYPKPFSADGPPIWIGGESQAALKRVATYGDGWHPTALPPSELTEKIQIINRLRMAIGNKKKFSVALRQTIDFSTSAKPYYLSSSGLKKYIITGSIDDIIKLIGNYSESGVDHLLCTFDMKSEALLTEMTRFAKEVIPSFA